MRVASVFLIAVILGISGNLFAQNPPTAAPASGSAFTASGTAGIDFELTIGIGQALASADLEFSDPDNPGGGQVLTLNFATPQTSNPANVTPPGSSSGTGGANHTVSWIGTIAGTTTAGNYDYDVQFEDDEGTPNVVDIVVRIIVVDSNPFSSQGADATSGDGSVGNPYSPANQVVGTTPVLDLVEVDDLNTGQTLVLVAVVDGGGNPPSGVGFTIDDNNPGVGATMIITATANGALNANDVGTYTFEAEVEDGINTIFINISITVVAANADPVLGAPSGTVDIVVGGTDPNFTGTATVGDNLAITFQATDANGADTLTISAARTGGTLTEAQAGFVGLPANSAGTSPESVSLTGTAANTGNIIITVDVNDGNGGTDTYTIDITISAAANPAPTITVTQNSNPVTSGGNVNLLTGTTVAAADFDITVNDASTGDSLVLTAGITNQGTTGILIAQWEGNSTSPAPINATPGTGTFNAAATLAVTLTANDGVNPAVNFTFNIVVSSAPSITVSAPNGGENFTVGSNMNVTWTSAGIPGTVDILLSTDGGASFPITLAAATANDGAQTIVVPNNPSTQCRVRVRDTATPATNDASDSNFTIAVAAPSAVAVSSFGNPGNKNVSPGSTSSALGFRLSETGGGSSFTVTSVSVDINLSGSAAGVAAASITSVSLRRGGVLQTVANGGAGWSLAGSVLTVNFTGLSSVVNAGSTGDYTVAISYAGTSVPSPNPRYIASITPADINGGASVSGTVVTGGTLTLVDELPDDPLDDEKDDDSCQLAVSGGPAWPLFGLALLVAVVAVGRRVNRQKV